MKYNYYSQVFDDIIAHIEDENTVSEISHKLSDRYAWEEELIESLWNCDDVTGNASGSYFANAYKAEDAVLQNIGILLYAVEEFCYSMDDALKKGYEWCDCAIRCYLLSECVSLAVSELYMKYGSDSDSDFDE